MATKADILVVDDDPLLRLGMLCMLRDMGYAPIAARDPQRAIPMLSEVPSVNLLITDYQMPGMNGVELAELMAIERPGLNVLIVTGNAELPVDLAPGWLKLTKPFTTYELAKALTAVRSN